MLSSKTLIVELLEASPFLASLLLELRVDCVGCSMNKFCTLEELCAQYELDLDGTLCKLQERSNNPTD